MILDELFEAKKPVIGMVHLKSLPGTPSFGGSVKKIVEAALWDAKALSDGGVDGLLLENFSDAPFYPECVPPHIIAFMTIIGIRIKERYKDFPLGVNVLRNDARGALAIATAIGAEFIRVNVHSGATVTDQGIIQGKAYETLRYRCAIGSNVKIFADVSVKHAVPLGNQSLSQLANDTYWRAKADALVVSGPGTGMEPNLEDVKVVKHAVEEAPILAGSGVRITNVPRILEYADGVIVGTFFKDCGITANPVDPNRISEFMNQVKKLR